MPAMDAIPLSSDAGSSHFICWTFLFLQWLGGRGCLWLSITLVFPFEFLLTVESIWKGLLLNMYLHVFTKSTGQRGCQSKVFLSFFSLFYHSTSERSEWNGRKFTQKKFSPARIGVGGCRLSVRPSVRPSVRLSVCPSVRLSVCPSVRLSVCPSMWLCQITFEPVVLSCWNFGSLPNSLQVIFWH
jgi:hypothetical protein